MTEIYHVLIIQTAFIGDVVLTTPLIRAAKSCLPRARIDILVIPAAKNLLENHPDLDQVFIFDKRKTQKGLCQLRKLGQQLRQQQYDLVLSPHRSLRSAILALMTGAKNRIGFDTSAGAWLYTQKISYHQDWHEVNRNLALLASLGCQINTERPQLFPADADYRIVDQRMQSASATVPENRIAMAPGSVWATKKWPAGYFIQLAQDLIRAGKQIWLVGGAEDASLGAQIAAQVGAGIHNVAGQLTLLQSAALIQRCRLLISNDSAPQHLGVAVGTPVITIFGSTVPEFGFAPYGAHNRVVEIELDCRPCGIHGHQKCPLGTLECMAKILPQQVFAVVQQLLAEN